MRTILVTGANGEMGHGLIPQLAKKKDTEIITLDITNLDKILLPFVKKHVVGDISDEKVLESIFRKHKISVIFHLAAILSTGAEKNPERAIAVNTSGTAKLLELTNLYATKRNSITKFIFPSTIAVYGMKSVEEKEKAGAVNEKTYLNPITIYGVTKLYCENLGVYYANYYRLLENKKRYLDFRCIRFPGIISAHTLPTGGTSDYAPEMIHSAVKGEPYNCFVRPDSTISFIIMPDAIKALLHLEGAAKSKLTQHIYNIESFSISAKEVENLIIISFPKCRVSYKPDTNRQRIVDSWPQATDDKRARKDWGWKPDYNLKDSFEKYIIPGVMEHYALK